MILTFKGCSYSKPTVNPSNYKTGGTSTLKKKWHIQYRYYDPEHVERFPQGKFVIVKNMNTFKTLEERRAATGAILKNLNQELTDGYNPITDTFYTPEPTHEIHEKLPFLEALTMAITKMKHGEGTMRDVKSTAYIISEVAKFLKLQDLKIGEVKLRHIRNIFDNIRLTSKSMSAHRYNKHRSYLMMVFNELLDWEACEFNPVNRIKKEVEVKKIRETLSVEDRKRVDDHLRKKKMTAYRLYLRIFFHSGAREKELFGLQVKKVNLPQQYFIVTIAKGKQYREVKKTIPDKALRYWKLLLKGSQLEDYVFSKGLVPGPQKVNAWQASARWRTHVKKQLGITSDCYSLKHSNSTETSDSYTGNYGQELAAAQNSHTSSAMVVNIYDVRNQARKHEALKKVANDFV